MNLANKLIAFMLSADIRYLNFSYGDKLIFVHTSLTTRVRNLQWTFTKVPAGG